VSARPPFNKDLEQIQKANAVMINPLDLKTVLLAKHAQHVVLIHFPIALFITAVAFDLAAQWTKRQNLADAAYYNLLVGAISTLPVLATGVLAWQLQLEGQTLKGILLLHPIFGFVSSGIIWLVWWMHFRARRRTEVLPRYRLAIEFLGVGIIALTGHLGGFLSGVNGPG
jgi:uncharacterized membrane protein